FHRQPELIQLFHETLRQDLGDRPTDLDLFFVLLGACNQIRQPRADGAVQLDVIRRHREIVYEHAIWTCSGDLPEYSWTVSTFVGAHPTRITSVSHFTA